MMDLPQNYKQADKRSAHTTLEGHLNPAPRKPAGLHNETPQREIQVKSISHKYAKTARYPHKSRGLDLVRRVHERIKLVIRLH